MQNWKEKYTWGNFYGDLNWYFPHEGYIGDNGTPHSIWGWIRTKTNQWRKKHETQHFLSCFCFRSTCKVNEGWSEWQTWIGREKKRARKTQFSFIREKLKTSICIQGTGRINHRLVDALRYHMPQARMRRNRGDNMFKESWFVSLLVIHS